MLASLLAQVNPDGDDLFVAQNIFFGVLAVIMLVSAWRVVTTKNVVHAALYLVIVLAGVAGAFSGDSAPPPASGAVAGSMDTAGASRLPGAGAA